jgi:hypothetical protein
VVHGCSKSREREMNGKLIFKNNDRKTSQIWRWKWLCRSIRPKIPNRLSIKKSSLRCIIINLLKVKEKGKNLKTESEKQLVTYKGISKGFQ